MSNLVPVSEVQMMATAVAKSGLFGIKTPDQAMALMLIAQAEGMHPAIAARDFHIIQGRPALKADAMLARFQTSGGKVDWKVYTDQEVTGVFSHPQGGSVTLSWTIEQARSIGLAGKENWRNYPRAMLRARCISEGIRTVYPGCVVGVYTPEEIQDFDVKPTEKDMGPVEIIEESTGIPLRIPGSQYPYKNCANEDEWLGAFEAMIQKIKASVKLSYDDKVARYSALLEVNNDMIEAYILNKKVAAIMQATREEDNE
jgi:hypothetical protein